MIPSEYETIIQMLLNEVIRLRRESDNRFTAALVNARAEAPLPPPVQKKHEFYGNQYLFRNRKSRK